MFSQASVILSMGRGVWQTPPFRHPLGRHPSNRHPFGQTNRQTPPGRHHPGRHHPCPVHAGIHISPAQCMLGYTHPTSQWHIWDTAPCPVYAVIRRPLQRTVIRIVSEYILVCFYLELKVAILWVIKQKTYLSSETRFIFKKISLPSIMMIAQFITIISNHN